MDAFQQHLTPDSRKLMIDDSSNTSIKVRKGGVVRISVTVDELIAAFGPKILAMPSTKQRDPVERDLLRRLGDPNVDREQDGFVRVAGERPTTANARKQ
jgi:hypothetical protein